MGKDRIVLIMKEISTRDHKGGKTNHSARKTMITSVQSLNSYV